MSESASRLAFLHALTGLHAGSGTALGVVDLPIQRERHTQWPVVWGSAVKGVFRAALEDAWSASGEDGAARDRLWAVFGPDRDNASDHAGAVSFTDARILLFPVRSLLGVYAWVTCPEALRRFARDCALAGVKAPAAADKPSGREAVCAEDSPLAIEGKHVLLEEFEFLIKPGADGVRGWLAEHALGDPDAAKRIVILPDDDFDHFVQHATEVTPRIAIDSKTKTVAEHALFYEEYLPAESVLYSVAIAEGSRSKKSDTRYSADEVLALVQEAPGHLQFGAGQTIGKGICRVQFVGGEGS